MKLQTGSQRADVVRAHAPQVGSPSGGGSVMCPRGRVVTGAHLNGEGDSQVKFIYSTLKTTTDDQRAAHLR